MTQANGCDSVVISTVLLLPSDSTLLFDKSCDINNVGVFTQNLTNQFGCDSTVVTTVTFALSDTTYLTANTCDPAQAGVFFNNLTSADGCDSLIITTVTALPLDTVLVSGTTCNLSASGVFTTVLPDQSGCDSTIITTITFVPLDTTFLTGASCDLAATGVFTNVLTTAGGCDSVLVTTVSLLPSSATALNGSSCNPAEVGVFTTVLTNQFGCDSTITTTIVFAPLDTTFLTGASCDPGATGVFTSTLQTAGGCDSVVVTTISLLPSNTTMLTGASCNPADTGVFTSVFSNQFGCDSTVITTVSLLPSSQTALQTTTCDPTQAGVFTYNLLNQFGCDSIVTETRALLPSSATTVNLTTCDPTEVGSVTTVLTNFLGCDSVVTTITTLLPANACGVSASLSGSNIPCAANTGTMTLTVTVGAAPFTYTVLQGATTVATGTVSALNTAAIIQNLPAGNYTVQVASPNGFSTSVSAAVIQLIAPGLTTIANSNYSGFDVRCPGAADGTALATATGGQSPYSYSWSNGGNTAQISGLLAGAYSATVTDANGCTGVSTVVLTEPTLLELSFVVNDLDCFGENDGAIQIQTSGGAPPYQFSLNGGAVQAENLFVGLNAGVFTLEVTDANNCMQEDAIVVNAAVPLDVDLGDDIKIGLGDQAVLQAVVNVPFDSILSVVWTPPLVDEECPNCLTHVVAPFVSTVYSVTVEALNGCTDEDKVTVIVDRRRQIYVPNIFSPNDDGANDLFSIYAKPGTVRKVVSLQIFDRWGNALYSLEDFLPNSPTIGWDGSYKGSPMNPGVFVWVAEIEFIDGEKETFKGDVTIVR
jgi:gliding motility-associated-like protein